MLKTLRNVLVYAFSLCVLMVTAQAGPEQKASAKIDYAEQLLMHSTTAKRIEESKSEKGLAALQESRGLYQKARDSQSNGHHDQAESYATEALRAFTTAARFLAQPESIKVQRKEKYANLTKEIFSYLDWYETAPYVSKDQHEAINKARSAMARAKDLANENKFKQANQRLSQILEDVVELSNQSLENSTVISTLDFDTAEEEFEYELARNEDYEQLIPIAIEKKQPSSTRLMLMKRFEKKATEKRAEADQLQREGEFERAIELLQASTDQYIRALGIVGVR
ncbi:MAG: hypothetical protein RI556_10840 [Hydrogenovibrio sp.]|uniref:hypothetical protein n=1 Tax=Hydrogenovibrio sp. TaxID=2065821 RepID=UPI00286FC48A|nr:hypothetical protein [Hydrogenovibrio sp.]MDR9499661.1 hypothetical protein [Hydrogenovibrio sp.]